MDEPLHPSSLSEILDRTAQIYRSRFLVFLGISVFPTAALLVVGGGVALALVRVGSLGNDAKSLMMAGVAAVVVGMLALLAVPFLGGISALAMAAMNHASSRAFLGQASTIRESYKAVWKRGWRYFGLFVFEIILTWVIPIAVWFGLTIFSAVLIPLAVAAGVDASGGGLLVLAGFLVVCGLVVYGCWISIRMSLAFPATVVEQIGVWDGLKRSSALTNGSKGRIFLLYLLGAALNWILSFAITIPLLIVMSLVPAANSPQHAETAGMIVLVVFYGGGFAVQAFTRPVYGIALMLFYYDQRIRQEAFDIEWMMLKAGLVVPVAESLMAGVPEASSAEAGPMGMTEATAEADVPETSIPTQRIHENTDEG
jgi:membrane-anchored glycerophosphoryl diester phosphodiesterase (GDPDase)